MYESKDQELLSRSAFLKRVAVHVVAALALAAIAMILGILGHMIFEDISFHDAVMNTAFVLGGIGLITVPSTAMGKLFIALYSFMTGLFFVASIGVILAPLAHRIIHKFHLDAEQ